MKVLGLDLSISSAGWAVIDSGNLIACGKIQTKKLKTTDIPVRLVYIMQELDKIVKQHSPSKVVIEDVYHGVNPKTTAILNRLHGAVVVSFSSSTEVVVVGAATARKNVLGQGKTHPKEEVFETMSKKYNLTDFIFKKNNDETDAILLAEFGLLSFDK